MESQPRRFNIETDQGIETVREQTLYPSSQRAAYTIGLLVFAVLIAYIDRQVMGLLVTPVKAAFNLSDARLGMLQGLALNVTFGLAAFPLGLIADRGNRIRLIWVSAIAWSVFTALSGLSTGFWQLFACRMGVGIAEAGLGPASYSMIADLYPPHARATATAVFYAMTVLAASAGVAIGGLMIDLISHTAHHLPWGLSVAPLWRLTFFVATLPGILLASLFLLQVEPPRKDYSIIGVIPTTQISLMAFLRSNSVTVTRLLCSLVAASIGVDGLFLWMPAILNRNYGVSPAHSGEMLGVLFGIGTVIGIAIAATLSRSLRGRWGVLAPLQVLRGAAFVSWVTLPGLLFVQGLEQALAWVLVYTAVSVVACGVGPGLMMTMTPQHLRGRIYAIYIAGVVLAATLWPTLIGILSDRVFNGPRGLLLAFCTVVIPCSSVAPVMLIKILEPFRRTIESTTKVAPTVSGSH